MKIHVLRKMKYEDTFIYVMQFGAIFMYLFSWDDGIHQDHITLKPSLLRWVAYWLRLVPLYTTDQLDDGEGIVLSGAMKTIDTLIGDSKSSRAGKRRRHDELVKKEKMNKKCFWQSREAGKDGEDKYYICLVHGEAVKMEEGVKPKHN